MVTSICLKINSFTDYILSSPFLPTLVSAELQILFVTQLKDIFTRRNIFTISKFLASENLCFSFEEIAHNSLPSKSLIKQKYSWHIWNQNWSEQYYLTPGCKTKVTFPLYNAEKNTELSPNFNSGTSQPVWQKQIVGADGAPQSLGNQTLQDWHFWL